MNHFFHAILMAKLWFPNSCHSFHIYWLIFYYNMRLPRWHSGKEFGCRCRRCKSLGLNPWVGKIPSILAWRIPWTEEAGRLQSVGLQRVRHIWVTEHTHTHSTTKGKFPFSCLLSTIYMETRSLSFALKNVMHYSPSLSIINLSAQIVLDSTLRAPSSYSAFIISWALFNLQAEQDTLGSSCLLQS